MTNNITVSNISKKIKDKIIVSEVSLEINTGEIIGLLGPNGAGKTTCFYMLLGLIPLDAGKITLDNNDISKLPIHKRAQLGIGYLAQEPSVFRKLTVADNIMAILELRSDLSIENKDQILADLLAEFNLTHLRSSYGMSLSGGERRRVEIARTLATEPKFILLDEPFAGVDPISVSDIQRIIRYLANKGIGILITDHNVRETLEICNRVYIMNNSKVICQGSPDTVINNPKVKTSYLGDQFQMGSATNKATS